MVISFILGRKMVIKRFVRFMEKSKIVISLWAWGRKWKYFIIEEDLFLVFLGGRWLLETFLELWEKVKKLFRLSSRSRKKWRFYSGRKLLL